MNTPTVGCVKSHKMSKVTILQNVDLHPNSHSITGHRFPVMSKHSTATCFLSVTVYLNEGGYRDGKL